MKLWLKRLVLIAVILEVVYLAVINLALNIPHTQTLINKIKPDKFAVSWDSAWSAYPFRVNAKGIASNGQTRSQQWQVDAPAASASISLVALFFRSVNIHDLLVTDLAYMQRPRPKPDKDYAAIHQFFPVIKSRKPEDPADLTPFKRGKGWKINLLAIQGKGTHRFWIYQLQGILNGRLQTELSYQTRGGPLSLQNGMANVSIESLVINGDQQISEKGFIKGAVGFSSFVPSQTKGMKSLTFLNVDTDFDIETESLAFLNFYLSRFKGLRVDGAGKSSGHLRLEEGNLLPGSNLAVAARELSLDLLLHRAEGVGTVNINVDPDQSEDTNVNIAFQTLNAFPPDSREQLFSGHGVTFSGRGGAAIIPLEGKKPWAKLFSVIIPSAAVRNMSVYNRYIPARSPFQLVSGEAELTADIRLKPESATGFAKLQTKGLRSRIDEQEISGELTLDIHIAGGIPREMQFDVSGSSLLLDKVRVAGEHENFEQPGWQGRLDLENGQAVLKKKPRVQLKASVEISDTRPLVAILSNQRGKYGWIEKTLTLENVRGVAHAVLDRDQILIPFAFAGSGDIDFGAKGIINKQTRNGMFYVRYKKMKGVLKTRNKKRNFDVIKARKKFDEYSPSN